MTKKAPPTVAARRRPVWSGWKFPILLSFAFCILAFLGLHSHYNLSSSASDSLTRTRHRVLIPRDGFAGPPKIAFLFLVRLYLPLDFIWDTFFENADTQKFSIFVHSKPGLELDQSTTRSHFFYGRQIKNSIPVEWGKASMIKAERLLLAAALEDAANQRFVLLSDSCVPLYNFSYIYSYLMASPRSFVDSFLDGKEGRYHPKMSPVISKVKWRKGSQWISLIRSHAEVIVNDEVVFSVFEKLCKRRPPVDASKGRLNIKLQKQHNCIPDEHYVQTLLSMSGLESELERRTLTYTEWNLSVTKMENRGWHPITFSYADAGTKKIKEIKGINRVYYETEHRKERCCTNSTPVPCFLFARKFSQGAAMRLLSEGVVGPFDASALLATPP